MNTKELRQLRKAAFAIAFGTTMGEFVAAGIVKYACKATDVVLEEAIKVLAHNGNKRMQELCEEYDVEYEKNKTTDKVIIGFHA